MPMTLQIDPVPPTSRSGVAALARDCGIEGWRRGLRRVTERRHHIRARGLARVALAPVLLVLEHPGAELRDERAASRTASRR
jgi:hypothetical protein